MFIDEISSRKCDKTLNISYIKVNNESINSVVETGRSLQRLICNYWTKYGKLNTAVNHRAGILSTAYRYNIFS